MRPFETDHLKQIFYRETRTQRIRIFREISKIQRIFTKKTWWSFRSKKIQIYRSQWILDDSRNVSWDTEFII